jgi:hypothetical protein
MKNKFLLFILIAILFTSCEKKYIIKNESVYLKGWSEANGGYERLVPNADSKTFENMEFEDVNCTFGKDKYHVYMDGEIVKKCDPKTFEYIDNYFFRDKNAIYFFCFYNSTDDWRINSINPKKFKIIKDYWATDGEYLLNGYRTLKLDDLNSFVPLNENWGKTKTHIIYQTEIVKNVDYNSFEVIDLYSGKDKNHTIESSDIF